jgi:hypothetical protein
MKTLAYALYVVTVLLISGLARANASTLDSMQVQYQSPINISQVVLDGSKTALDITGSLPNYCYGAPSAALTEDKQSPNVLVLHLSSTSPKADACFDRLKYFATSVPLSTLVQMSHMTLDPSTTYTLKVDGYEFAMQIAGSELMK